MDIKENKPLKKKTTMKIGGSARFYAEVETKEDMEEAYKFAQKTSAAEDRYLPLPIIVFGAGSNTIFADGIINALVVRIKASQVEVNDDTVQVESGKNLAQLINELANQGLDLSPLTGIPGNIGGAVVGNAGQGPKGKWLDSFVESVTVFENGEWKVLTKGECEFSYRESIFKSSKYRIPDSGFRIIWEVNLNIPSDKPETIKNTIESLLTKRIESQPHTKTSGSCFKAAEDGTPAWQLIEAAGLRGFRVGGVQISDKHSNFLINEDNGSFADVIKIIETVKEKAPDVGEVEMRLIGEDGGV
ncbi:UDP-N-acetylmuramate dehydrogenase, partial [Patescibacteria group bacterium]|nr:UDP-N-acetylmuramate dehydrogenase [Patescibacteria group bacterium]